MVEGYAAGHRAVPDAERWPDRPPHSLQESFLTALAFDSGETGIAIAARLDAALFEPPYRNVAERVLAYRQQYGKPPGKEHIDDVFAPILEGKDARLAETYTRILIGMLELAPGLNVEYLLDQITEFERRQTLKTGVLKAAERYQMGGHNVADDVARIMRDAVADERDFDITEGPRRTK